MICIGVATLIQMQRAGLLQGMAEPGEKAIVKNIYQMHGGRWSGSVLRTLEVLFGFLILTAP